MRPQKNLKWLQNPCSYEKHFLNGRLILAFGLPPHNHFFVLVECLDERVLAVLSHVLTSPQLINQ